MSNKIQIKLMQYEAPPPPELWNRIADSLDEHMSPITQEKIFSFEQKPPSSVWSKISKALDNKAAVVPFYRRRSVHRYSAAAAVFIAIAITTSLLISKKTQSDAGIPSTSVILKKERLTEHPDNNQKKTIASETSSLITASLVRSNEYSIPKRNILNKERLHHILQSVTFSNLFPAQAEPKPQVPQTDSIDNKYIVYSDEEGNAFRVPKKVFDLFSCALRDVQCKQRLNSLREQIASGSLSADFTGILDMLNNLKENQ
jgi:hypothetical protein